MITDDYMVDTFTQYGYVWQHPRDITLFLDCDEHIVQGIENAYIHTNIDKLPNESRPVGWKMLWIRRTTTHTLQEKP